MGSVQGESWNNDAEFLVDDSLHRESVSVHPSDHGLFTVVPEHGSQQHFRRRHVARPVYSLASQWFGLTKPELKALLSEPSGEKFIFSLAIRQLKPYSLKECERLYARVVGDCDANNMSYRNGTGGWAYEMATIRGKHGRALLKTNRLPRAFILYMSKNLQKKVPVTDFIKYMSQEIQPAYPALDTLDKVWQLLKDYNRWQRKSFLPAASSSPITSCRRMMRWSATTTRFSKRKRC